MGGSMGMNAQQRGEPVSEDSLRNADVDAHFRQLDDGRTVFYPRGLFGRRGFVVANTKQEALLRVRAKGIHRRAVTALFLFWFWLGFVMISIFIPPHLPGLWPYASWHLSGFGWVAIWFAAMWGFSTIIFKRLTDGMESAHVPNSPIDCWRSEGQAMHPLWLILLAAICVGTPGVYFYRAMHQGESALLVFGALWMVWLVPLGFMVQGWWRGRR